MKDEDLLETNTGGTSKVYMGKSEARPKKTRRLEDEDEEPVDEEQHEDASKKSIRKEHTKRAKDVADVKHICNVRGFICDLPQSCTQGSILRSGLEVFEQKRRAFG